MIDYTKLSNLINDLMKLNTIYRDDYKVIVKNNCNLDSEDELIIERIEYNDYEKLIIINVKCDL